MTRQISDRLNAVESFPTTDIGGTDSAGADDTVQWIDMRNYEYAMWVCTFGTWNVADSNDVFKVEQATSAAGAGKKDVTGKTIAAATRAITNVLRIEIQASDLDSDNGFVFARLLVGETDNTGVDNVSAFSIRTGARFANENETAATAAD